MRIGYRAWRGIGVRKWIGVGLTLLLIPVVAGAEPSTQELLERIQSLEKQVEQMRSASRPTTDQTPLADAAVSQAVKEARSQRSLSDDMTAGYSPLRGFVIQSTDHAYLVHPWLLFQFRNVTNERDESKHDGADSDTQNGFEVRRMKLGLDGNVFSPDVTYQFIFAVDRKTGAVSLDDAWFRYHFAGTPIALRAGQIRNPFDHEQIMYGVYSQTVERSLVDSVFANGEGLVQGVSVSYDAELFRTEAAFSDGMRSASTNFQDYPTTNADWGVSGRAEWKLLGDWRQYNDFSALGDTKELLVAGAGLDYTEAGSTDVLSHVVDLQYEHPKGFACYAAYLGRYTKHNRLIGGVLSSTDANDTYDSTLRVQAAYVIDQRWEPFARYEYVHFDGRTLAPAAGRSTVHEFTVGVNYFIVQHFAKLSADVVYLPNGCPISDDGNGILALPRGQEVILRAQLQIWR